LDHHQAIRRIDMSNEKIIRALKDKRYSVTLGSDAPVHPAGDARVALQDIETGNYISSPASVCSIGPRCQCG